MEEKKVEEKKVEEEEEEEEEEEGAGSRTLQGGLDEVCGVDA